MYKLIVNNKQFSIPKESLVPFAWQQAMDRGIMSGNIHDEENAIEYLSSIGMKVEKDG